MYTLFCQNFQEGSNCHQMAQVGVLAVSASQAGIGCFKQFALVLTPKSSWPQVWGSKVNEGKMKLKNMHLHRGCKVPGDSPMKCSSRGGNRSLVYSSENCFVEHYSCTNPSNLIFKKNRGVWEKRKEGRENWGMKRSSNHREKEQQVRAIERLTMSSCQSEWSVTLPFLHFFRGVGIV